MNRKQIAEDIFLAAVKSVSPSVFIPAALSLDNNLLKAGDAYFDLSLISNIYVIGAGKATASMALETEKILGSRITTGHIIVKYGHSLKLKYIKVTEAGHPVPDRKGFSATSQILELVSGAGKNDLVICLISGGGSSLLADYPEGSSPTEMTRLNDLLVKSGACISEINAVRKHLSSVKGGQLARIVCPAALVSLILSDVPGDPLDVIASGPTVPDPSTFQQALEVIDKYGIRPDVPAGILKYLEAGRSGEVQETPKPGDPLFSGTWNFLAGSNSVALEAAREKALEYNINALVVDRKLQGDVVSVAGYLVETALRFRDDENEVKPVCLLFGGETTVKMTGKGKGGRNQHLALLASMLLRDHPCITILSAGTDGNDGPTSAAGAVVDSETFRLAAAGRLDPEEYLAGFDSYHFFKKAGGHIITGPTMTNVMDIIIVLVEGP